MVAHHREVHYLFFQSVMQMNIMKSKSSLFIVTLICLMFQPVSNVYTTEEFAAETGRHCGDCHLDPLGGGGLTELGKGYLLSFSSDKDAVLHSTSARLIRFAAGYIHMITAFLWFGTILYVHLVLKPAYASQGLPRGEVRVGLVSMLIMALTGFILSYYKIPSLDVLIASRFGILLLAKIVIFLIMVFSAMFVVFIIGPKLKKKKSVELSRSAILTLADLANFDGEEGRPAYFAFKGKIYDVTGSKLWAGGNHMKRHKAGADLTDLLSQAPHEKDKILSMPEVGRLSETGELSGQMHEKVFYFMAYMNLGFVFVITLILALWRWY